MFRTVLNYYVAFCGFIFLIVSGFIPYIVRMDIGDGNFYPATYWSGIYIIPIIMGGYFFNGLFNQFSMGVNITKTTKYLPIAVGIAATVNLVGNIILMPKYGMDAAAWLTLFSYSIAAAIIYYLSQKVYPITYDWKKIIVVAVSVIVIFLGMKLADPYVSSNLEALPAITTLIVYPVLLYLFGFFGSKEIAYIKRLFRRK
jgi:O-antigen/teichoic acid export membrane protein